MDIKHEPLKLLAKDLEDLKIMAAHLQDALTPLLSMSFDDRASTFTLMANRFCWEYIPMEEDNPIYHRVHSGLVFKNVKKVLKRGFLPEDEKNKNLNLLSIHLEAGPDAKTDAVHLVFSGGREIRLEVEQVECLLGDLETPYATHKKPQHLHEHFEEE